MRAEHAKSHDAERDAETTERDAEQLNSGCARRLESAEGRLRSKTEVDDQRRWPHEGDDIRIGHPSAAWRDDHPAGLRQLLGELQLQRSEPMFALLAEDLGDRHSLSSLDFLVEIEKRST